MNRISLNSKNFETRHKMRILILLLACLAIANAASYVQHPCGYTKYSIRRFYVFPTSACLKFRVHFSTSWFTTKYYSSVMSSYPGTKCGTDDFQEMTKIEFKTNLEKKLKSKADAILKEMNEHYDTWLVNFNLRMESCKTTFADRVNEYTNKFLKYVPEERRAAVSEKMDKAVSTFTAKIDKMASTTAIKYKSAIQKRHNKLIAFHGRIVNAALKCFQTRSDKIAQFKKALTGRIKEYFAHFKKVMSKLNEKKVKVYRCLLYKMHGSKTWEKEIVDAVVNEYKTKLSNKLDVTFNSYADKINGFKDVIVQRYACSYQCTTYTGCLNFFKKKYYNSCKKLGTWWTFRYTKKISCFKFANYRYYAWKKPEFKKLKTCDIETVNKSPAEFEVDLSKKVKTLVSVAKEAYKAWELKWTGLHKKYYEEYQTIVTKRHKWLIKALEATYYVRQGRLCKMALCKIESYTMKLASQKTKALKCYEKMLADRLSTSGKIYVKRIEKYETNLKKLAEKITARYQTCLNTRMKKIEKHTQTLNEKKDKLREALKNGLTKVSKMKINQYKKMLAFYFGEEFEGAVSDLFGAYKSKVNSQYLAILDEFDQYWNDMIPKLEQHYACGYKCNYAVKFTLPVMNCSSFQWRIVYPTTCSYKFSLKYYRHYYGYVLKQNKSGCYIWSK
ncbi:uncharacterized protein LOC120332195 [Styela clava]